MSADLYVPTLSHPASPNYGGSGIGHGSGAPGATTPNDAGYIDDDAGTFYINVAGTWTLVTGGVGSGSTVHLSAVDPEGVVTGTQGDITLNTATGTIWFKESAGSGTTGWVQRV